MLNFVLNHIYILLSILFAVGSQLIIKWQMSHHSLDGYSGWYDKFIFAITMLIHPYIMLAIIFNLLGGLAWMIAMTKFDISYAYPYTTLGFVLILIFSSLLFNEAITIYKIIGMLLIVSGILVVSRDF
ncbi:MAG: EamA family transporter [Methyloprofundus sp.]|nr:EamA family transporter [Methyloprofundus sp.]